MLRATWPLSFLKRRAAPPSGYATLEYVGGKIAAMSRGTTNLTISLTGLTGGTGTQPAADDLVIIAQTCAGPADRDMSVITAGYTKEVDLYNALSTYGTNLGLSWKRMGATPDSSVVIPPTGDSVRGGVVAVHVWRNAAVSQPDVASLSTSFNGSGTPNPPAITPVTPNAVVIAIGAQSDGGVATVPTTGSLSNFLGAVCGTTTYECCLGIGSTLWGGSGAVDPAAFGGDTVTDGWSAASMVIRPAALP